MAKNLLEIEARIHDFLCEESASSKRLELILSICRDPEVREAAEEIALMHQRVRFAIGHEVLSSHIHGNLSKLREIISRQIEDTTSHEIRN